jgi:hypothetical protein
MENNNDLLHIEIHVSNPEGMYLDYRNDNGELKFRDFISLEAARALADRIYKELDLYK